MFKKSYRSLLFGTLIVLLSGCSSFTGLRTPRYDGQPFVPQPDKIAAYEKNREILGEEKELFIRESFSEDMFAPSLAYENHEPVLLEEGTYVVGEDFPASRVTLFGEKNDPTVSIDGVNNDPWMPPQPEEYEVGTLTIRDAAGNFYFEHMFHPFYGTMMTQVDLIEGHTIEIIGNNPSVIIFYDEMLPEDPYVFDTRWEDYLAELEAQGATLYEHEEGAEEEFAGIEFIEAEQIKPLEVLEDGNVIELRAGVYEVGVHFEPGTYEITDQISPSHTELYLFQNGEETRVFELSKNLTGLFMGSVVTPDNSEEKPIIELQAGDKIYPRYVSYFLLTKIAE